MPKIEIADDSGNEISEISIPIPFYIRVKMEEGMKRYRIRLIDDFGKIRGQYMGGSNREYIELHIPLIRLSKPGQLRILIEESTGEANYLQKHQVLIKYLPYSPSEEKPTVEEYLEKSEIELKNKTDYLQETSKIEEEQVIEFNEPDQESYELYDKRSNNETIFDEALEDLSEKLERNNEEGNHIMHQPEFIDEDLREIDIREGKNNLSPAEIQEEEELGISEEEVEYLSKREEIIKNGVMLKKIFNNEEE